MEQEISFALRKLGLFGIADRFRYELSRFTHLTENRAFLARAPNFTPPPPELLYEVSSAVDYRWYLVSGERLARTFSEQIDRYLPTGDLSVCEWGCGIGRIIRHMFAVNPRIKRATGIDYDKRMIEWCQSAILGIDFHTNDLMPPTRFEPHTFDVVYCFSVLTHLSEAAHHAWINDMARIVRPGGLFIFTTMGDGCTSKLLPAERSRYDAGELVVRTSAREGARIFATYESELFVRSRLLRGREILAHISPPDGAIAQDMWVVRM